MAKSGQMPQPRAGRSRVQHPPTRGSAPMVGNFPGTTEDGNPPAPRKATETNPFTKTGKDK